MKKMIIDGHAYCAGVFFREDTLAAKLEELQVDKVVLCRSIHGHAKDIRLPFDQKRITSRSVISYAGNRFLRLGARLIRAEAGRLTLGSDTPFGADTLKKNIDKVRGLALGPADKELILGLNMARLLQLPLREPK